jgi:hypothetical protein
MSWGAHDSGDADAAVAALASAGCWKCQLESSADEFSGGDNHSARICLSALIVHQEMSLSHE